MSKQEDFFTTYLEYVGESEAPTLYHRWTAVSVIGALLSRSVWLPFGHGRIYANQYLMLMGSPGTRKGTAMNVGKRLLKAIGYKRFAPDRVSKERFLVEMKPRSSDALELDLTLITMDEPYEIYAFAEEFTDLVGQGGMEFMTMLTKLWDNVDQYEHPKLHGRSISVENPTVNILGGNTAQGLLLAIPPEALGNGFMSRMIFIFSEPTGIKLTWPPTPDPELQASLVSVLDSIQRLRGEISVGNDAKAVLDRIYKEFKDVDDYRFKHYSTRRFTHLLKLCMVFAVSDLRMEISAHDALRANTLLHYTEQRMPKALGEFGRSKYSEIANIILEGLERAHGVVGMNELWKWVHKDLAKQTELHEIVRNLLLANKIQVLTVKGKQGYAPKKEVTEKWSDSLLLPDYLTPEEMVG